MDLIILYAARIFAVVIVLSLHEFAHAFVAYRCGDPTAKWNGRLTLNPLKHFDTAGLIMFILVGFGWAKPVPINPYNFKSYKRDLFFVSAAGVALNYILAFLSYPLMILGAGNFFINDYMTLFLAYFINFFFIFNLNFCVFNLIPLYPLDGFRIWDALSTTKGKVFRFLQQYGYYILLGLIIESYICDRLVVNLPIIQYFDILGFYLKYVIDLLSIPIQAFWGIFL